MTRPAADTVTEALRHLDPAPRVDLTEAERERADAAFARIVATPVRSVGVDRSERVRDHGSPERRGAATTLGVGWEGDAVRHGTSLHVRSDDTLATSRTGTRHGIHDVVAAGA